MPSAISFPLRYCCVTVALLLCVVLKMWWSDIAGPPQSGPEAEVLDKAVVWAARVQGWPSSKVQCSWFTSPQPCFCSWLFFLQHVQGRVRSVSFKIWKSVGNWDALFPALRSLGNTWGAFPRAGKFGEIIYIYIYISFLRPGKWGKIRYLFFKTGKFGEIMYLIFKTWKVWGTASHFFKTWKVAKKILTVTVKCTVFLRWGVKWYLIG